MYHTTGKNIPLKVAAYIRVSTDSSDQENSYETQSKYFTELLWRNPEWVSAGVYSDYGTTGTDKEKRTGFKRLLRHCSEGKIDRIVCKSVSRFARNTSDFMMALSILHENQVTLFFEKEGLDTAALKSDFILITLAAIAQEESRSISANVRWGIQKRYPKGQARNCAIYGYRFAGGEEAMEAFEDGYQIHRVEIVEEEAEVVRRIFQSVSEGMAYIEVARMLNREQIKAPNYGRLPRKITGRSTLKEGLETGWTDGMISRMLVLERYCGDVLLQKTYTPDFLTHESRKNNGEVPQYMVLDHHPAIIDRELFDRVQAVRKYNAAKFTNTGKGKRIHAFSGKLVCAECGCNFNVRNANYDPAWFCPSSSLNNGKIICHSKKVYEEQVVRMFRKAIADRFYLLTDTVLDDVKVADIMNGHYGEDEMRFCRLHNRADDFLTRMRQRLENIQKMDFMERDRGFLKRQIAACQSTISEADRRTRTLLTGNHRLKFENTRQQEAWTRKKQLEEKLNYLENYWETVELNYEEREKTIAWMKGLPEGAQGAAAFLNELTGEYVRAFIISIIIHDPLHYTVHWFDDTRTDVRMHSNIEDDRCFSHPRRSLR